MKYKKDEMVSNVSVLDEKNNDAADKKESSIILKLIISFFTGGGFSTLIGKMVGEKGVTEVIRLIDSTLVVVVVFLICLTVIICILINRIFEIKKIRIKINNKEPERENKLLQGSVQIIQQNIEELEYENAQLRKRLLNAKGKF